jgi:glutamyl-tRNA synthetase
MGPLVVNDAGERLAKRDGRVTISALQTAGVPADDVVALITRSLDLARPSESVALDQLVDRFDPDRIPREPITTPRL